MTDNNRLARARTFLWTHARLLERCLFERLFDGRPADAVVDALRAYRRADGGFGHALECDVRAPSSQPLFVHVALTTLEEAGVRDPATVNGACAFLARVADERGAVPYLLPDAMEHPHADHWAGAYALQPTLRATAAVIGGLHAQGARDAWLDRATAWCFDAVEGGPEYTPHLMLNVLSFLRHAPDRARADAAWHRATARMFAENCVLLELHTRTYGLSPLRFARSPDHPARSLFEDKVIDAHLDALVAEQQDDGGWPIHWNPPGAAAISEWRGKWTLDALAILRAYGRI